MEILSNTKNSRPKNTDSKINHYGLNRRQVSTLLHN
ncbi:hypothetical protein LCUFL03_P20001 [Latilactobacillus curvatus]|nr:hypothetical protein LCUFL03_P20001 [Latilactobacillus curvatus]